MLTRNARLVVRAPDGQESFVVTTPADTFPAYPVWSPDGTRIAYVHTVLFIGRADADWGSDIYIVDASGADQRLIWRHERPGEQVHGLAWTADGAALLFGYQRLVVNNDGRTVAEVERIERLDLATGARTTVADGGLLPSLSRDGQRLAYRTAEDFVPTGLWIAGADGSGARLVLPLRPRFVAAEGPRLSPDGTSIVFAAASGQSAAPEQRPAADRLRTALRQLIVRPASAHGLPMDLWRVNVADGALTRLTQAAEDDPYPAWSPDGATLTLLSAGGLYTMRSDGSNRKQIGPGAVTAQLDAR